MSKTQGLIEKHPVHEPRRHIEDEGWPLERMEKEGYTGWLRGVGGEEGWKFRLRVEIGVGGQKKAEQCIARCGCSWRSIKKKKIPVKL